MHPEPFGPHVESTWDVVDEDTSRAQRVRRHECSHCGAIWMGEGGPYHDEGCIVGELWQAGEDNSELRMANAALEGHRDRAIAEFHERGRLLRDALNLLTIAAERHLATSTPWKVHVATFRKEVLGNLRGSK